MPFGLKSAPATFMRFVHEVLYSTTPELKNHTKVYLDNILIYTNDDLYQCSSTFFSVVYLLQFFKNFVYPVMCNCAHKTYKQKTYKQKT